MDTNRPAEEIRDTVSKAYAEALRRAAAAEGGCCGPAASCEPVAVAAQSAGYATEAETHAEAAAASFGCGNPLAFSGVQPGQTVLDLGSGAGFDLLIAAERVGPTGRVIGVDMTDDMIAAARRHALDAGATQVEVRRGLIEDLPVRDGRVDWVISNCVINLSPEKPRVFAEIARVLKPGGEVRISDIVAQDMPAWVRGHAAAYAACIAGAISEADYVAGLEAAGLVDVEVAERIVYSGEQLRGMVAHDLANLGLDAALLDADLEALEGTVWSAQFTARKPAPSCCGG